MIGIYKITSPSGKIYIGQSVDLKRRLVEHHNLNRAKKHPRLHNSFLKHGVENHTFEVITECNIDELNNKERYYQDIYSVIGKNGLNCSLTNHADKSGEASEESKLKMSESRKGKTHSECTKLKISESNKGNKHSYKSKLKMSECRKGKTHSKCTKLKMSESRKKVILNTQTGIFYLGIEDAANSINTNYNTLCAKLIGTKHNQTYLIYV